MESCDNLNVVIEPAKAEVIEPVRAPKVKKPIVVFKPDKTVLKLKNPDAEVQSVINQVGSFLYDKTCTTGWNGCLGSAQVIKGVVKKRENRYVCKIPVSTNAKLVKYLENMVNHAGRFEISMTIEVE